MLNDKMAALTDRAGRVGRTGVSETERRDAKVGLQTTAVYRQGRDLRGAGQVRPSGLKRVFAPGVLAAALASLLPLHGAAAQETPAAEAARDFDLPATDLAASIDALGRQGGVRIDYPPGLVAGRQARAVTGHMGWHAALDRLLQGSGLTYRQTGDRAVVIEAAGEGPTPADPAVRNGQAARAPQAATDLAQVTVTGTRIRGGATPSPVIAIGSERIREEGFADLGEVIRSIPQNFSGGQNPAIVSGAEGGGIANQNITGGSALNLRGLGPDATLTLLNGRRLAYSGFVQAVDIGAIPVEAIDRLELIPDGASAIYGSDAVGGVGNVILKRDYNGITLAARYGGATDGGLVTREYSVTAGSNWDEGGLIATWKKSSSSPVYSSQRDYTDHLYGPTSLFPESGLRSGLVSAHQSLGGRVELQLDALRSERDQLVHYTATANNYFPATARTTTSFVSPVATFLLPNDWSLSTGTTWGADRTVSGVSIGTAATGAVALLARSLYRNSTRSYEIDAEGPMFELPGGDARLAVGVGHRTNGFRQENLVSGAVTADGSESSRFAFAEINLPLLGAKRRFPGTQRLELTGAIRTEDYDSFGAVTTPKLGVIYGPGADVTVRASWGRSFKAPTLLQRYQPRFAHLRTAASVGGTGYADDATVLIPYGGNPDLDAERARTWSASITFHPEAVPALEAELGWFDIEFTGRIAQPLVSQAEALSNPTYAPFIDRSPTADDQAEILATSEFRNFTGSPYDPASVVAIAYNRYINTVAQRFKGLDLSGSYGFTVGDGRATVRGSLSWLDATQQATIADRTSTISGTLFHPAGIQGRAGVVWDHGGLSASTFVNHVGGVTGTVEGRKSGSFTTMDVTLRYAARDRDGLLSGMEFALSATNLLDRPPPLYTHAPTGNPPYDSTNYSPIGRFLSVGISRHW